jgi:hypothetical protein
MGIVGVVGAVSTVVGIVASSPVVAVVGVFCAAVTVGYYIGVGIGSLVNMARS